MESAQTLFVSTLVAASLVALVLGLAHVSLPKDWHPAANLAFGSTVCLTGLSAVMITNGLGWQWVVVAWLIWVAPGVVVCALYVADENARNARKRKREDEQPQTANS